MQTLLTISPNCLKLIKKWQGLYLDAYLDQVGIWTIGYGTTEYPDGKKVKQGDKISIQQAKHFLKDQVDQVADQVNQLVRIALTQNQFDALVSFCYNVGNGAFKDSILLKKLNQRDYQGAANELIKWNEGMVNGVKKILPALVDRRDDEKHLFLSNDFRGNNELSESFVEDKITWLEVCRTKNADNTLIVGWTNRELMQLFQVETHRCKNTLVTVSSNSSDSNETKIGQKSFATN